MPAEWVLSVVAPIINGKYDNRKCSSNRTEISLALNESGRKGVKKGLHRRVSVNEMQFGSIPERGTIDAIFVLRMMQEEYHAKGKK